MKHYLLAIILLLSFTNYNFAQVGIGTNTPDASAQLELSSASKGFLPTRIALTAANTAAPVTSPAAGLLVYNTATAGTAPNNVVPGYYYWNGTGWIKLATGNGNMQAGTTPGQIQYWNGTQWILLSPGAYGAPLVMCNGVPSWGGCLPILAAATMPVTNISGVTAVSGGTLLHDGGVDTVKYGVCYSTSPSPTILNSVSYSYEAYSGFTCYLTGLNPNTTYYVRAFATNPIGTVYGSQVSFTTNNNSAPTISSFSPESAAANQTITIFGSNFSNVTSVKFGGTDAVSFIVYDPNTINAVVGSGASGSVSVTTTHGTASKAGFTYITQQQPGPTSDSVATANLIGHWPFDGGNEDVISSVAAYSSAVDSYPQGQIGNCASFINGYLLYNSMPAISKDTALKSYSISMWVNVPASTGTDQLRSLFQVTGNKYSDLWGQVSMELANYGAFGDTITIAARQHQQDSAFPYDHEGVATFKLANSTNRWIFLTQTYNGTGTNQTMKIYANGQLLSTTEFTNVDKGPSSPKPFFRAVPPGNYPVDGIFPVNKVYIGTLAFSDRGNSEGDGWGNFAPLISQRPWAAPGITAKIDDIRLFNKALSNTEVTMLYNYGLAGK